MTEEPVKQTPDEFRAESTRYFDLFCRILAVGIVCLTILGWCLWGYWGMAIGLVIALVLATPIYIGVSLIYVMTQDGG
jgi:hypothetical protein